MKKEIKEILQKQNLILDYVNNTQVWYNEDRDIFISNEIDACFQQYALEYQDQLEEIYNDGAFDEEIQILKSEGIQYPQIWQCVKYIVEVDENASLHLTKIQDLYVLKVID